MSYTRLEFLCSSHTHSLDSVMFFLWGGQKNHLIYNLDKKYHNLCSDNQLKLSIVKKAHSFIYKNNSFGKDTENFIFVCEKKS